MNISEINIYPIKSLKGIALNEAAVEDRGLRNDRRWMLVDAENKFLTQREFPKMSTIQVEISDGTLSASANGSDPISISFEPAAERSASVTIWSSHVRSAMYPDEINGWFSEVLGTECRLVRMPDEAKRTVNPLYAVRRFEDMVSFADGFPFMVIGQASLDDLNSKLETPVPMNRFRPNLVVAGSEAFAEDTWKKIRIGDTEFHVVKPCERCVITTVDQASGETGKEPLKTLNSYRNQEGKVLFGQNLIAEKAGGTLRTGDPVEVLEFK